MALRGRPTFAIVLVLAVAATALADQTHSLGHRKTAKKASPKPLPLPPMPPGPLPQLPMDMLPAVAPHVTYQNGSLAIVAQNSTLADVLREVRKRTGATIDVPPNANERVMAQLGPGPVRDVLVSLLNGCSFNYVMLGTATDPNAVSSLVLTAKPAGGAGPTAAANPYQPNQGWNPPQRMGVPQPGIQTPQAMPPVVQNAEGDNAEENQEEEKEDQDQADDQGDDQAQPDQNPQVPQGMQQPPNAAPKTPEQILQMLQRGQGQVQQPQPNVPPDQNPPQQ